MCVGIEYCIQILISKPEGKLLPERWHHRQTLMVNLFLYRPIGLQDIEALDNQHMKVARLSALCTGCL